MSTDPSKSPPLSEDLRGALDALGREAPPDEREFSARLHRRLVAAGPPPALGWLERAAAAGVELLQELARDARQKRSLLTGAVIGALATATTFLLLSGGRPLHDGTPAASPDDETADVDGPNGPNGPTLGPTDRKAQRAVGDRRLTRDRLGDDIGAERPERARGGR
jgi:hypothetical protein